MTAMTVSDVPSAMPTGDANPRGAETGDFSLISVGARDHGSSGPEGGTPTITERVQALRTDRARRVAEAPSRKDAAAAQWGWIRDEITLVATLGFAVAEAWIVADQRLRDLREAVAAEVTIRVAEVEMRSNIRMIGDSTYPTYEEKVIRRRENRDNYWTSRYVEHGGTPDRDAPLTWSRIGSEVAKLRKHDLAEDDLWIRITDRLRDLHVEVTALLGEVVQS
jgi:hypothetical protein